MDNNNFESKKRIRKESGKRWTREDKNILLSLISENPTKFEKPTAQIFYGNIIKEHPRFEEYSWKAMRDKLRNLRAAYTKAVDWIKNTGSGLNEEDAETSIGAYILKICEDFEILQHIFSTRRNIVPPYVHESVDTCNSPVTPTEMQEPEADQLEAECSYVFVNQPDNLEFVVEPPPSIPTKRQRVQSNNSTAFLAQAQTEKTAYLREKLEFLKKTEERKLRLEEQKLDLERERLKEESRLKEMELKYNFELSKMRMEREMALKEKEFEEKYKK